MSNDQALSDFDPDACLCQMKVVPEDKRVDFQMLVRDPKTGKPKIKTVLRYHKDCPTHGVFEVHDA
jgi:hypothetical protein